MCQPFAKIAFRVRYADMPWLYGMHKDMVAALNTSERPAILLKLLNQLFAVHGGYYNH